MHQINHSNQNRKQQLRNRAWPIAAFSAALLLAFILPNAALAESSKPKGRQRVNNKAPARQRARAPQRQAAPQQRVAPQQKAAPQRNVRSNRQSNRQPATTQRSRDVTRRETRNTQAKPRAVTRQSTNNRAATPNRTQRPQTFGIRQTARNQSQRQNVNINLTKNPRRDVNLNIHDNRTIKRKVTIQSPQQQRNRDDHYRRDDHHRRQHHRQRHHNCHHQQWHYYDCSHFTFDFFYGHHAHYTPYYAPTVIYTTNHLIIEPYPTHYRHYVKNTGWHLLAEGHAYRALEAFKTQLYQYPDASLPKAGMALARALLDQDYAAAEDLREAFRRDPEALAYLPVSQDLDRQLLRLIRQYEEHRLSEPHNRDWRFMLAALSYFRHDYDRASYELSYLFEYGDEVGYATKNLNDLIYDAQYEL